MHLRAIYDKNGEFGLKEGIVDAAGVRHGGGYFMAKNPDSIYDAVYQSVNPWAETEEPDGSDMRGSMFGDGHRGQGSSAGETPKNIEVTVACSLAEFYNGCMKTVEYEATEVQHDARTVKMATRSHKI